MPGLFDAGVPVLRRQGADGLLVHIRADAHAASPLAQVFYRALQEKQGFSSPNPEG